MSIVDNAVYVNGYRTADPESLDETYFILRQRQGMAWIGLYRPDAEELRSVAGEFDLNHLAVDDALAGHQRAKLEHYGETLLPGPAPRPVPRRRGKGGVRRDPCLPRGGLRGHSAPGRITGFGPGPPPDGVPARVPALGPDACSTLLDQVVDEYEPVVAGLENDVDEIEDDLFAADPGVSRRIYELSRQVIMFQRATAPLVGILQSLMAATEDRQPEPELQDHYRDVLDHVLRLSERIAAFRALLQNALAVNAALVAQRQNDEMRLYGVELRPERAGQADLLVGGHSVRADTDWHHLWNEFPQHAGTGLGFRLPDGSGTDDRHGRGAVLDVQAQQVDLACSSRERTPAEITALACGSSSRPEPHSGAPGGNRTPDRRIRRPLLYPLSYWGVPA